MKKIISILLLLAFSITALAEEDSFPAGRVAAIGDEPNGNGQIPVETNQAGVSVLGAGSQQVSVCLNCEKAGNDRLPLTSRIARPGLIQSTSGSNTPSGAVDTGK